jgi:dTDP-4-dehydrorhamnose 3,5-epimerase
MRFEAMAVAGAYVVALDELADERGFFARAWCEREFARAGIEAEWVQANVSVSRWRGTLRGMHYQRAPKAEAKLVRCTRGALYDVVLDLRAGSPTRGRWAAAELSAENRRSVYVPPGCAHGFLTLADDTEAHYLVSAPYAGELEGGVRWDDRRFGIEWPGMVRTISGKDAGWPDFEGGWL